VFKYYWLFQ